MEKKLTVVASHSYERAQLLKTLLEDYNIEVCLQDINLMGGTYQKGARVCVYEEDFERALGIVEDSFQRMEMDIQKQKIRKKKILIPIDFNHNWDNMVRLGFNIARQAGGEIMFIHVYYSPMLGGIPFSDSFSYATNIDDNYKNAAERAHEQMEQFMEIINKKIEAGHLPKLKIKSELLTGIPEDEIIAFSEAYIPSVIVMGTRGKEKKISDMIGSVTAEVMDRAKVPVFAIPEDTVEKIKRGINMLYVTSLEERDFQSFDKLIKLLSNFEINFHIVHFSEESTIKEKTKIEAIGHVFKEQFITQKNVECSIIETSDFLNGIEKFVREHDIDVISMTTHRRNIFARIFNPGIARRMLFHGDTPMLIFHQ